MLLYEMLEQTASAYGDRTALIYTDEIINYRELKQRVDRLHKGLLKRGIEPGERVGLILHNSIDFVVFLYALSKNGNIVCLLNAQWSVKDLERKIAGAGLSKNIVESYVKRRFEEENSVVYKRDALHLKSDFIMEEGEPLPAFSGSEDRNAFIQSSSGTTGFSKMAYRTYKNLDLDSCNIIQTMNYKKEDVVFSPVPLYHGYGLTMGLIAPVRCGAAVWIQRWFDGKGFLKEYEERKPSVILGIPEIYDCLYTQLEGREFDFKYKKWFLCSGEPVAYETGSRFYKVSKTWVSQIYGMMEVSTICANLDPREDNFMSVGRPIEQIKLKLKPGKQEGFYEIYVKGDTVSDVYLEQGQDVVIPKEDGWFCTRDIGYQKDGDLFLTGRKKEE